MAVKGMKTYAPTYVCTVEYQRLDESLSLSRLTLAHNLMILSQFIEQTLFSAGFDRLSAMPY